MRIRKRLPVPPPPPPQPSPSPSTSAASAAAAATSDPQLITRPPPHLLSTVHNPTKSSDNPSPPRPPNQEMITRSANPRWGFLTSSTTLKEIKNQRDEDGKIKKEDKQRQEEEEEDQRKNNTRNDPRKGAELDISDMHVGQTFYPPSSASSTGDDDADDDHKVSVALPLKKRKEMSYDRSNIVNLARESETYSNNNKKESIDPKMKCKTNKCVLMPQQNAPLLNQDSVHQEEINTTKLQEGVVEISNNGTNSKKTKAKKVRGSEIMEGSRCSRVNGRGWRCWQQTPVGYALCEHHLGKGRLRSRNTSINRVRSTNNQSATAPLLSKQSSSALIQGGGEEKAREIGSRGDEEEEDDDDHEGEMKMGNQVVKARSISSLLGQTNDNVDNRVVTSSSTYVAECL